MKIRRIAIHQIDLPLRDGPYAWSGGNQVEVFDSTVVAVDTDDGLRGWGEVCPLGAAYLPSFPAGARAAIAELAPQLIGRDAPGLAVLNAFMDQALLGHPDAKSALDMALWDLHGKAAGMPCSRLMGGRFGESVALYRAISSGSPEAMAERVAAARAEGYARFQLKVGVDVDRDVERIRAVRSLLDEGEILVADANTGWTKDQAMRVVRAVRDLDVYVEQPCASYEDCLSVRRHCPLPFVLDESVTDAASLARARSDLAMDVVNLKISKLGGLTRAVQARDWCVAMGIPMTLEDCWGGDIVTAAIAHLAHSTPERYRFSATDFNSYVTVAFAAGAPRGENGFLRAPERPGLGVDPDLGLLGEPLAVFD
jgi:L-alanine-DL-glutamate epimerase-like enolase superfamily enzyme